MATAIQHPLGPAAAAAPARTDPRQAAATAAQEFEAVYLNTIMAQMFQGLEGEGPMGGGDLEAWRSFLTDAYSREISAAGGVGIAEGVYRELLSLQEVDPA